MKRNNNTNLNKNDAVDNQSAQKQVSNLNKKVNNTTLKKVSKSPEIVQLGNHIYKLQYDQKENTQKYVDITLEFYPPRKKIPGYKKIDLNKLTQPVLDLAIKKANKLKQQAQKKGDTDKLKKLNHYSKKIENMPIWMVPEDKELLLRWLAIRKLKINSEIGAKLIVEAYNEYYNSSSHCLQCKKSFTQKSGGRTKQFCSTACKQKYYRRKKAGYIAQQKQVTPKKKGGKQP